MDKKRIVLMFGEMGSGKSYLGKILAKQEGLFFVEGDNLIPPKMRKRIAKFLPPSSDMIEEFIDILSEEIGNLADWSANGVVVSQALYKDEHRHELIGKWQSKGFSVDCMWVKSGIIQNIKQLWSREKPLQWLLFWLISKPWFEAPTHRYNLLRNKILKV